MGWGSKQATESRSGWRTSRARGGGLGGCQDEHRASWRGADPPRCPDVGLPWLPLFARRDRPRCLVLLPLPPQLWRSSRSARRPRHVPGPAFAPSARGGAFSFSCRYVGLTSWWTHLVWYSRPSCTQQTSRTARLFRCSWTERPQHSRGWSTSAWTRATPGGARGGSR